MNSIAEALLALARRNGRIEPGRAALPTARRGDHEAAAEVSSMVLGSRSTVAGGEVEAEDPLQAFAGAIPGFVKATLSELRTRNALVIAWIHVALRAVLGAIFAWAAATAWHPFYAVGLRINAAFLLAAVAVLGLLWRRWFTPWIIRVLILLDLVSIAISGWRVTHSLPPAHVGTGVAVVVAFTQLLLPSAALVLPSRDLAVLGVTASLLTGTWCALGHLPQPFSLMLVVGVMGSSAVVIWAARHIVRLAIQQSLEAYSASVLRAHRDDLDAANRRIRESQSHAERLTQLIVHDLKNPLTVVLTHLALVSGTIARIPGLEEESEDLLIAHREGMRLQGMIGDLLLVSRLEKGDLPLRQTRVGVQQLLEAVGRPLQAVAAAKNVRLEIDATPDLVALLDADLIRRLIENLVSNGLRYTKDGDRIQVAAWLDAGDLRIAVRNSGPAVSPEIRGRLFEKYGTEGLREWHNVGLGLYACRLVAEAHGGRIELVDSPGWNVAFEAVLPTDDRPAGPARMDIDAT